MSTKDEVRKAAQRFIVQTELNSYERAKVGMINGDGSVTIVVPKRTDFIYVTKADSTVTIALNRGTVPLQYGLPIKMRVEAGVYVVQGRDRVMEAPGTGTDNPYGVNPHNLDTHTDVTITTPVDNQFLRYNGTAWVNETVTAGAVDSVNGQTGAVVLDTDDIAEGATNLWFTAAEETKLAGIEALADVTDAGNVGAAIDGATEATGFADANKFALIVSGALRWISGANLKATLKTYFDTLYTAISTAVLLTGDQTVAGVKTFTDNLFVLPTTTSGNAFKVIRDLAAASTDNAVVALVQDNAGDDQPVLYMRQDGSASILQAYDGSVKVLELADGGNVLIGDDPLAANQLSIGGAAAFVGINRYTNSTFGPGMVFRKSRNASVGSHTIVSAGDEIGKFTFQGSDGSAFRDGAIVVAKSDGTPGASDMPSRLEFQVTPAGSATPATVMTIKNDGNVAMGPTSPQGRLHVHDGTGGWLKVSKTGIVGSAQTIIPDGTGDVLYVLGGRAVVRDSAGAVVHLEIGSGGSGITPGGSQVLTTAVGNAITLSVAANGSVTVVRTAGTRTFTLGLDLAWL